MSGDDGKPAKHHPSPDDGDSGKRAPSGSSAAWGIVSYLLSGIIAWGGIGWLADEWLGTRVFIPIGVLIGFAGAFYLIIRRYGGD